MKAKNFISNPYFLKIADMVTRQQVMYWYDFFYKSQWWSRDELIEYQNINLKQLISTAYNELPFYKNIYSKHGVKINSIKCVTDLHQLPIITKKDLKSAYPNECTRRSKWPVKEYHTSGSTGTPFAVLVDNQTMSQARSLMLLRANYSGWKLGEAVFQTGMTLQRGLIKKIKDLAFNVHYASAYDLRDEKLGQHIEMIKMKKIKYIMGYPGSIYALSKFSEQHNCNLTMEGIVTWGDNLYKNYRKNIEAQFKCRITDTYGCGEGIQVAAQCPKGFNHYHIFMPHVIVEIVDDNGKNVKRGDQGNILLTRLLPGAMPLIRYKIGDVGKFCKDEYCECGCGFDILDQIDGRCSDFIYTPNNNRLIVHFFTGIFEYYPQIDNFRVHQETIDKITIDIVKGKDFNSKLLHEIKNQINKKGDPDLTIKFNIVDKIDDNNSAKRKFVVSTINRDV
jgi:phenylacetate-CoA ligase